MVYGIWYLFQSSDNFLIKFTISKGAMLGNRFLDKVE